MGTKEIKQEIKETEMHSESFSSTELKELLGDPRDLKIAKLKDTIESYKNYDANRQKYYSKALQRLGMLESAFQELQNSNDSIDVLKAKIASQRMEIERLIKIQTLSELYMKIKPEIKTEMIDNEISTAKLVIENEKLTQKIESLNYIISKLIRKENNNRKLKI